MEISSSSLYYKAVGIKIKWRKGEGYTYFGEENLKLKKMGMGNFIHPCNQGIHDWDLGLPASPENPVFNCPRRPNLGREGRPIVLRANHFRIDMPRGYLNHYQVYITPDKCPRRVNRDIVQTMVREDVKKRLNQMDGGGGRRNICRSGVSLIYFLLQKNCERTR